MRRASALLCMGMVAISGNVGAAIPSSASTNVDRIVSSPGSEIEDLQRLYPELPRQSLASLPHDVRRAVLAGDAVLMEMQFLPNGPQPEPAADDVGTRDFSYGSCGVSFFWIYNPYPNLLNFRYGFSDLCFQATAYQWSYTVAGPNYSRSDSGGGTLWFRREWNGSYLGQRHPGWVNYYYSGCVNLWAQGTGGTATGTACDTAWVNK